MEDPFLPKKTTFGNYAVQRKSCLLWSHCSILTKKIFKFIQLTGFPFFVVLSVSVEPYLTIKETHFILPEKRRFLEEFLKCYNALWLHFKNTTLLFLLARKEIPYNLRHMWRLGMVYRVLIYHPWMICGSLERKKPGSSHVTDFSLRINEIKLNLFHILPYSIFPYKQLQHLMQATHSCAIEEMPS